MARIWNEGYVAQEIARASGTSAMNKTIDNAAAANQGGGLVRIPSTGHGFLVGSTVVITGSVNYNGMHVLQAVATNTFDIKAAYVAETFAGTETVKAGIKPKEGFQLLSFSIHLSAASATAENLVLTKDALGGSAFDAVQYSKDMNTVQDLVVTYEIEEALRNLAGDSLLFTWANTNTRTWGLEMVYRRLS